MKTITFPGFVNFGGGDSCDVYVDVALSDEEAERLESFAHTGSYFRLGRHAAIKDIYAKVYDATVAQVTEEIRSEDYCDAAEDPNWTADKLYRIDVNFPEELQHLGKR